MARTRELGGAESTAGSGNLQFANCFVVKAVLQIVTCSHGALAVKDNTHIGDWDANVCRISPVPHVSDTNLCSSSQG